MKHELEKLRTTLARQKAVLLDLQGILNKYEEDLAPLDYQQQQQEYEEWCNEFGNNEELENDNTK